MTGQDLADRSSMEFVGARQVTDSDNVVEAFEIQPRVRIGERVRETLNLLHCVVENPTFWLFRVDFSGAMTM